MYAEDIEQWINEKFKNPERAKSALAELIESNITNQKARVIRSILYMSEGDYDSIAAWVRKANVNPDYIIHLAEYDNREVQIYNFSYGLYEQMPYTSEK